jgi:hypothetical protein
MRKANESMAQKFDGHPLWLRLILRLAKIELNRFFKAIGISIKGKTRKLYNMNI